MVSMKDHEAEADYAEMQNYVERKEKIVKAERIKIVFIMRTTILEPAYNLYLLSFYSGIAFSIASKTSVCFLYYSLYIFLLRNEI